MPNKNPYGPGQKIYDQVEKKINRDYDGIYNRIRKPNSTINKGVNELLKNAIFASNIREIIEDKYSSFPHRNTLVNIESRLKKTEEWQKARGEERHRLLLEKVREHSQGKFQKDFKQHLDDLEEYSKPTEYQKERYYKFIMMMTIASITNPQIEHTYMMQYLPSRLKKQIQEFRLETVQMLLVPHKYLVDKSLFPHITDKHANNFIRSVLLKKLDAGKDAFDHDNWNTFFPYNRINEDNSDSLKNHIHQMYTISENMSKAEFKQNIFHYRAKLAKRISITGLLIGAGIFIGAAGSIGLGVISGGVALLALGVAAGIAYIVYKNNACSAKEDLLEARDEYINSVFDDELDPKSDEGAEMYNDISNRMRQISDERVSPETLKAEVEDRLISDLGPSITSTVLNHVLETINPLSDEEMNAGIGVER